MAMTPKENEDICREIVKRHEEELEQAHRRVDVATWALKTAEEKLAAAVVATYDPRPVSP